MSFVLDPRPASASLAEMTEPLLPSDANAHGTAFGGRIMSWIDLCASIAAQRHCRRAVVTASMDQLHFHAPVKIGHWAVLRGKVVAAFKSSMEIYVTVHAEDPVSGQRKLCTSAFLTFVALDENGRPNVVPPVLAESEEERTMLREAEQRRAERLARKSTLG